MSTATADLTSSPIPANKAVRDLLVDLLGREVELGHASPWAPHRKAPGTVAAYVDDRGRRLAFAAMDVPLSGWVGGALGLVPAERATEAVEEQELPANIWENLAEVYNIGASLFNVEGAPHLRLDSTYQVGDKIPTDVSAYLRAFGRRLDLEVTVEGYGSGRLLVVTA